MIACRGVDRSLEILSSSSKSNLPKNLWSSTFYVIASDRLFELCSFAGPSQEYFPLLLARTRGRNFQWSSKVIGPNILPCQKLSLKSPRFSMLTGGLNYDCVQRS